MKYESKGLAMWAVIVAFVLSGVGASFDGFSPEHAEASETARVYDHGNLIAAGLDSSKAQLEIGPDMFQSHERQMKAIPVGHENLKIYRENEPMPMGPGFGSDILVYGSASDDTGPRIAANPLDNSLWVVFTHFNGVDNDVILCNSTDLGSTWNPVLWTTGEHNESNPAIAIMGNVIMIAYEQDHVDWEQRTYFIRSLNGGQNWGEFFMTWNWTNHPGGLQLEDFNNPDISISRAGWFHWTADAFGVRNNTRTVALMWTEDDGDSWWMVYWTARWHMGEDFEHPVIMENTADNYMHNAWQHWNSTEADWDIEWLMVDHGLTDVWGWWTAVIDGGNSEIAPDIWISDDHVFLVWQNGTDLTGFYSDEGGSMPFVLYITGNTPWNETYPSCFVDTDYELHVAFSNDTVLYYGNTSDPLSEPFKTYAVSANSSINEQYRTLDMFLLSDYPLFAWTDLRNSNPDIYFNGVVPNDPPVAVARPTYQEVNVNDTAWLYGNESYDVGGWIANYSWYIEGPSAPIQLYGAIVSFVPLEEGGYLANLTVRDNGGLEDSDLAYVDAIAAGNLPPVADAGMDQIAYLGDVVTFDGSGSYDPDGIIISYYWDFDDGADARGKIVTHVYDRADVFHVVLAVADDDHALDIDRAVVVVVDPGPSPPRGKGLRQSGDDLILEWELSFDDGDLMNYAIYYGTVYDPSGNGYVFLAEVLPGTDYYVHIGAGEGDWNTYFYYIQANDSEGQTSWEGQLVKFVRHLQPGMRIISLPAALSNYEIEVALQSIDGSYDYVRCYDSLNERWLTYWTFKDYGELREVDITKAYWIHMTREDHLLALGSVPESVEVVLNPGWNFVSYPSFIDRRVSDALAGYGWMMVHGYDDVPPFYLEQLSGDDTMRAGEGYWVKVSADATWTVSNG